MEFLGIRTKSGAIVQPNSGEEMIRKFDFAYSTPGLTTGVVVYNPTVHDILLDAWIEIDTAFNGTTPHADFSQFIGGNTGWVNGALGFPVSLSQADAPFMDSAGTLSAAGAASFLHTANGVSAPLGAISLGLSGNLYTTETAGAFTEVRGQRVVPAKITSPNPVKLVVTQDGLQGGAATGATQGAGTVYFLTGTPQ